MRDELNRPRFHFTPPQNWMNDPNGLAYYKGEYHLYYQHNPYDAAWGHMSWGHAVSRDLVHWADQPIALMERPDKGYTMFSGSAVVDWRNSSGFGRNGEPPLVAVYTADYRDGRRLEDVHIAYSTDDGRTLTEFHGNPVIHVGNPKFGDPKVFWHEQSGQWIMVAILGHVQGEVVIFGSADLKAWQRLSDFQAAAEAPGVWECPDLFPLALDGDAERILWALKVNVVDRAAGSWSIYFLGDFDGRSFRRLPGLLGHTPERGPIYAEVTYNDIPASDGRRILMGWMRQKPSTERVWTGMQAVPRVLSLRSTPQGPRVCQSPIAEMTTLRKDHWHAGGKSVRQEPLPLSAWGATSSEMEIRAKLAPPPSGRVAFRLHCGESSTSVGFDAAVGQLFVAGDGREALAIPVSGSGKEIDLRLFIDRAVVEVFANDGEAALSALLEPDSVCRSIDLTATGGQASLISLDAWTLAA